VAELHVLVAVCVKIKEDDGELSESTLRSLPLDTVEMLGGLTFEEAGIFGSSGLAKSRHVDSCLGLAWTRALSSCLMRWNRACTSLDASLQEDDPTGTELEGIYTIPSTRPKGDVTHLVRCFFRGLSRLKVHSRLRWTHRSQGPSGSGTEHTV
jgi:hypothetical protein